MLRGCSEPYPYRMRPVHGMACRVLIGTKCFSYFSPTLLWQPNFTEDGVHTWQFCRVISITVLLERRCLGPSLLRYPSIAAYIKTGHRPYLLGLQVGLEFSVRGVLLGDIAGWCPFLAHVPSIVPACIRDSSRGPSGFASPNCNHTSS